MLLQFLTRLEDRKKVQTISLAHINMMFPHQQELSTHLRDLRVEVLHVVSQHLSKLTEHLLMPRVILQIHLGLNLNHRLKETLLGSNAIL